MFEETELWLWESLGCLGGTVLCLTIPSDSVMQSNSIMLRFSQTSPALLGFFFLYLNSLLSFLVVRADRSVDPFGPCRMLP